MRAFIILVGCIFILGSIIGCRKGNNDYKSNGKIMGPDTRDCACCGGWYIEIDSSTYEFDSIPNNSNIDLQKDSYPIFVKLDWKLSDGIACPYKRITIQRITRRELID
jgi:hypothetical protein